MALLLHRLIHLALNLRSRKVQTAHKQYNVRHNTAVLNIIEDSRKGFVRFIRQEDGKSAQVQVDVAWWYGLTGESSVRQLTLMNLLRDALNLSLHIDGQPLWEHDKPLPIVIVADEPVVAFYFWGDCHVRTEVYQPHNLPDGAEPDE